MKTEFTPGPWHNPTRNNWGVPDSSTVFSDEGRICVVHGKDKSETEANARLIAAAPIMYEFIRALASSGNADAKKIIDSTNGSK